MPEERRKAELISHELMSYFIVHEAHKISLTSNFLADGFLIEIQGEMKQQPDNLEHLTMLLNVERDRDIEDYYDGLLGIHHEEDDYALLGIMTDQAEVAYDHPDLSIKLFRGNT